MVRHHFLFSSLQFQFMIKDFFRYWLGLEDHADSIQDLQNQVKDLEDDVDNLSENMASERDLTSLRSRVRELEGVGGRFTDSEWKALQVILDSDGYVGVADVSESVGTSRNNARAVINNVKEKVELDVKTEGRRKLYRVPEETKKEIFSN